MRFVFSDRLRLKPNSANQIKLIWVVQSPRKKYSASHSTQITGLSPAVLFPARGAVARRHERGTGCGGRESVGAPWRSQGELNLVSGSGRAGRTAFERTAKPCGPDTRCWCQVGGGELRPDRVEQLLQSAGDGDKTNSSPRRAWHKPSNHCAGNAGCLR